MAEVACVVLLRGVGRVGEKAKSLLVKVDARRVGGPLGGSSDGLWAGRGGGGGGGWGEAPTYAKQWAPGQIPRQPGQRSNQHNLRNCKRKVPSKDRTRTPRDFFGARLASFRLGLSLTSPSQPQMSMSLLVPVACSCSSRRTA